MKKLFLFLLSCFLLSSCALVQKRVGVEWPREITFIEGEGDLDLSWRKEKYSGSFSLRMEYPAVFLLEVYGPFGQTLVYVKKEPSRFLFVAGDEKSTDEGVFQKVYGLSTRQLIDDLAMKGQKEESPGGVVLRRADYRVVYGQDRAGKTKICWEGRDGRICLTFNDISFVR